MSAFICNNIVTKGGVSAWGTKSYIYDTAALIEKREMESYKIIWIDFSLIESW